MNISYLEELASILSFPLMCSKAQTGSPHQCKLDRIIQIALFLGGFGQNWTPQIRDLGPKIITFTDNFSSYIVLFKWQMLFMLLLYNLLNCFYIMYIFLYCMNYFLFTYENKYQKVVLQN